MSLSKRELDLSQYDDEDVERAHDEWWQQSEIESTIELVPVPTRLGASKATTIRARAVGSGRVRSVVDSTVPF